MTEQYCHWCRQWRELIWGWLCQSCHDMYYERRT